MDRSDVIQGAIFNLSVNKCRSFSWIHRALKPRVENRNQLSALNGNWNIGIVVARQPHWTPPSWMCQNELTDDNYTDSFVLIEPNTPGLDTHTNLSTLNVNLLLPL